MVKNLSVLMFLALAFCAYAEDYSGTVDAVKFLEGDKIVINGTEFLVNGSTEVYLGDIEVGPHVIEPGFDVKYSLDYQSNSLPIILRMELLVSNEKADKMLQH